MIQNSLMKLQRLAETQMATVDDIKETIEECAGRKYDLHCLEQLLNEVGFFSIDRSMDRNVIF